MAIVEEILCPKLTIRRLSMNEYGYITKHIHINSVLFHQEKVMTGVAYLSSIIGEYLYFVLYTHNITIVAN